jgi:hypothetical protein
MSLYRYGDKAKPLYRYGDKAIPLYRLFQDVNQPALRFFKLITEIQSLSVVITDRLTQLDGGADRLVKWTFLTSCEIRV